MKKRLLINAIAVCGILLTGCKKKNNNTSTGEPADPLDLGAAFNAAYYPKKEQNKVASIVEGSTEKMKIDVALNFEGTAEAWKELAKEYVRLCGGIVDVNIISELDTAGYTDRLRIEEANPKTDWDIVQGNLMYDLAGHCINLRTTINSTNPYASNKVWSDFLEEKAYITDVSGSTDFTYLLNTENLSTAWFVNTAATTAAGVANPNPQTWEQLIDMLEKLQVAGYKYPLGLTLTKDGINASQFSWLLRVYGDYYYRSQYKYTSKTFDALLKTDEKFEYDKTAENQEGSSGFTFSYNRALNLMLDESSEYYCGANSAFYKDFLTQFKKLAKYIKPSAYQQSFIEVRSSFMAQKDGGGYEAPQVMLDYTGSGLSFLSADALKGHIDFFDYPTIESSYVESGTLTRDVGGNGGYLAVLNCHNSRQTKLNKDFLQFVLSPYGQTIYYKALSERNLSPKGLTTVQNDLVVIPSEWVSFFQTDKITFTGLADNNKFIDIGVVNFFSSSKVDQKSVELWQKLLTTVDPYTVDEFADAWHLSLLTNWSTVASEHSWQEDSWSSAHFADPNYIKD